MALLLRFFSWKNILIFGKDYAASNTVFCMMHAAEFDADFTVTVGNKIL